MLCFNVIYAYVLVYINRNVDSRYHENNHIRNFINTHLQVFFFLDFILISLCKNFDKR